MFLFSAVNKAQKTSVTNLAFNEFVIGALNFVSLVNNFLAFAYKPSVIYSKVFKAREFAFAAWNRNSFERLKHDRKDNSFL